MVVTIIDPSIRSNVDQAAEESFDRIHTATIAEAARVVRERAPRAILLSPVIASSDSLEALARLVAKNPVVTPIAILGAVDEVPTIELLGLGACGVRRLLDLSNRSAWDELRGLLDNSGGDAGARILAGLMPLLELATEETQRFFVDLVHEAPHTTTVRKLAKVFRLSASTLMSRFFRAELPAPKAYLAATRLLYAAALFETSALSIVDVANALDFSSPQSFGRHVRKVLGLTAGEFRDQLPLNACLEHFRSRLLLPYQDVLRTFRPIRPAYLRPLNGIPSESLVAVA